MTRRAPHEGTIRHRSDGRWEAVVHLGYAGGSGSASRSTEDPTRGPAEAGRGPARPPQGITPTDDRLTTGVSGPLAEDVAKATVRPRTFISYSQTVRLHLKPDLGPDALSRLRPQQVQALLNAKYASGLSARSVGIIHAVLRRALNQALRWGSSTATSQSWCSRLAPPRAEIRPLTPEQARVLPRRRAGRPAEAVYSVASPSGSGSGEILGLTVVGRGPRGRDGPRRAGAAAGGRDGSDSSSRSPSAADGRSRCRPTVARPSGPTDRVSSRSASRRPRLERVGPRVRQQRWERPSIPATSRRRFQLALDRAGLPHQRFHDLRHTCASRCSSPRGSARVVMETLGHWQISLTLNTYSHVIPALQREAADRMEASSASADGRKRLSDQRVFTP